MKRINGFSQKDEAPSAYGGGLWFKHIAINLYSIALGILGTMTGAQGFKEIEDFGTLHEEWLKTHLVLKNSIPSHDTIRRAFQS